MTYNNIFANKTLQYIWNHPGCKNNKIGAVVKFFIWQAYKRLFHRHLDIQLISNVKIRCYPDSHSASAILYCGLYDYDEMKFLLRYLRPEDSFLDIGANIGAYTLLAASKINLGSIYSIEVLPKNYTRLQENIKLNKFSHVKTYPLAISDRPGTIELNVTDEDCLPFITHTPTKNSITVSSNTIDNLIHEELPANLTLAKMDIEGAELLALKGAVSILKQQRPHVWILEINDAVNNFGYQKEDVVNFLDKYGYHLYSYSAANNQLSPITLAEQKGNNILAIANSALDIVRDRLQNSFSNQSLNLSTQNTPI